MSVIYGTIKVNNKFGELVGKLLENSNLEVISENQNDFIKFVIRGSVLEIEKLTRALRFANIPYCIYEEDLLSVWKPGMPNEETFYVSNEGELLFTIEDVERFGSVESLKKFVHEIESWGEK